MLTAATDYPLMNVFWTMTIFFAWMIWIWLLITIFADLFSRHDIGGWGKAGWTVLVLVLPFVGVLCYLISQSSAMAERRMGQARAQKEGFDDYVRSVASTSSTSDIAQAKDLLDAGAITPTEYQALKDRALAPPMKVY